MREAVGPDIDILLDINYNFKTEGAIRLGRALEPYNLFWLEQRQRRPARPGPIEVLDIDPDLLWRTTFYHA